MAIAKINLYSDSLGTQQDIMVILPNPAKTQESAVLYLLHGLLDGHETWIQRTRLVEYAEQFNIIVVMPNAQRSFYADQQQGYAWRTWVETELQGIIEGWLGLNAVSVTRHIVGLSMGGYGALKLGLSQAERYKSVGSFSGVLHMPSLLDSVQLDQVENDLELAFGSLEALVDSENDLSTLVQQDGLPYLYITCGTEDSLLESNRLFVQVLKAQGCTFDYLEMPGGHEWQLWDRNIASYLTRLHELGLITKVDEE